MKKKTAGLIDADLLTGQSKFPNLALMKISGQLKDNGIESNLIFWHHFNTNDRLHSEQDIKDTYKYNESIYISKVFTNPPLDKRYLINPFNNVFLGGTGFGSSNRLPEYVEKEQYPDYDLYSDYVQWKHFDKNYKRSDYQYYLDWSIGFLTRGCFRHCPFCVNKDSDSVRECSPLRTFVDIERKYICLLDDNFLGFPKWEHKLDELESYNKPFQFRQGLDFRIMTTHAMRRFTKTKWKGDYIFAFDNIKDSSLIKKNLSLWRNYTDKGTKFYIFTGYHINNGINDIIDLLERVQIVSMYECLPFVMKHENYKQSVLFRQLYTDIARWANRPQYFKKLNFHEFCEKDNQCAKTKGDCASLRNYKWIVTQYPELKGYLTTNLWTEQ